MMPPPREVPPRPHFCFEVGRFFGKVMPLPPGRAALAAGQPGQKQAILIILIAMFDWLDNHPGPMQAAQFRTTFNLDKEATQFLIDLWKA